MGATPVADTPSSNQLPNWPANMQSTSRVDFRSFEIVDLAADQDTTLTGMREEILLLSWLIVLLRTREGIQVSFDWAYSSGVEHEPARRCLSMNRVVTGLQDPIEKVAAAISGDIAAVERSQSIPKSSPVSFLLSTGSLSRISEEVKDEVSEPYVFAKHMTDLSERRMRFKSKHALTKAGWAFVQCGIPRTCCHLR